MKLIPLAPGDLVLRKVVGNTKNPAWGKLGLNWEGPYRIATVAGIGAYYLEDLDERAVLHPWNVNNLKKVLLLIIKVILFSSCFFLYYDIY